jgi:hypothetical protein
LFSVGRRLPKIVFIKEARQPLFVLLDRANSVIILEGLSISLQ